MKKQRTRSAQRLAEEKKGVLLNHSFNAEDKDDVQADYVPLNDLSEEVRPHATRVLGTLRAVGINPEALGQGGMGQPLQSLLAKELSCSRYFRWAVADNFVEKILQGLVLNKQDISQKDINFCRGMV